MRIKWLLVVAAVVALGCGQSKKMENKQNQSFSKLGGFDLQGHRGCRGLMPENTVPAFIKALEIGVNTLEMDVVISKDSQVVVSHEEYFNHDIATKPDGSPVTAQEERSLNIYTMNYAEVKRFDVGMKPHPRFPRQKKMPAYKPLLSEVFDSVKSWCSINNKEMPAFNIEIKSAPTNDNIFHPGPAPFVELVMAQIKAAKLADKVIIQSFDFRPLQYLHEHYPNILIAALVEEEDSLALAGQLKKLGSIPYAYSPAFKLVNPLLVKQCKGLDIKLIPWTVNELIDMEKIMEMGVDGLITDYPNRFKRELK